LPAAGCPTASLLRQVLAKTTGSNFVQSSQRRRASTDGSEAVDIALQIAMASTGRRKFVSIEGSDHATRSARSASHRRKSANLLSNCTTISPPLGMWPLASLPTSRPRPFIVAQTKSRADQDA
jgi:4-aminobutyrate aminotransferase-like enzyme